MEITLKATARDTKASVKDLRRNGSIPCVLYGNDVKNASVQCGSLELSKVFSAAGESTLVDLVVDGKNVPVLIHEVQFEPVSGRITHVDFYAVDLKKEIEAPVPVRFSGESFAVKDLAGVFVSVQNHVMVRCLPTALPHDLEAPMSKLAQLRDVLTVADLLVPQGVKVKDAPTTVIATVQEQRKEEEIVAAPAVAAVEGEGVAAPGAEGAEGEAAEAPAAKEKKGKEE